MGPFRNRFKKRHPTTDKNEEKQNKTPSSTCSYTKKRDAADHSRTHTVEIAVLLAAAPDRPRKKKRNKRNKKTKQKRKKKKTKHHPALVRTQQKRGADHHTRTHTKLTTATNVLPAVLVSVPSDSHPYRLPYVSLETYLRVDSGIAGRV